MKKTTKLFFCGKNDAQISGFGAAEKAPSPWKKDFPEKKKKKKFPPAYLCGYDLQNGAREFFWANDSRDI